MKILFLHGWQSVPGGVKPTYLAQHSHEVINPKLPDEDFEAAMRIVRLVVRRCKLNLIEIQPERVIVHHWGKEGLGDLRSFFRKHSLAE